MKDLTPFHFLSFAAVGALYLNRMSPTVTVGDSGEYITASATLSLPHAPSYPLYTLLGKVFQTMVPWANAGYRTNLFSVFGCLAGLALLFYIGRRLAFSRGASLFAVLLLAASPAFFHNGLVSEVFALNTALVLGVWAALSQGTTRFKLLAAFLAGLGMGNHHTLLLVGPACLLLFYRENARAWAAAVFLFLLGFSIYLFLPLRSRQGPPLDWGSPRTTERFLSTVTRKDYGSLSLALGEQPARSAANGGRQLKRFGLSYADQLTAAGAVLSVLGLFLFWRRRPLTALALAAAWFFTGPFFAWLGNMPFDAQSDGILERFYILPAAFGALAAAGALGGVKTEPGRWKALPWFLCALALVPLWRSARAYPVRWDFLTRDYALNIQRTLPPGSAFFMDGGDDTFYSMAFERFVQGRREDLSLFDRGGLVFKTAYGSDFRTLTRERKEERRQRVEKEWLKAGPLYYSTMNDKILHDVQLHQRGFLYEALRGGGARQSDLWPFYAFRSVYPPPSDDYRTVALAPYFPFMRAKAFWRAGRRDEAERYLERARRMNERVPWLKTNLTATFLELAFERFSAGDWDRAERLYLTCLGLDGANTSAMANLGVVWEKRGKDDEALQWYERALKEDPSNVNALYNKSVVYWRRGDWARVVPLLEEVARLAPAHEGARRYLPEARRKLSEEAGR